MPHGKSLLPPEAGPPAAGAPRPLAPWMVWSGGAAVTAVAFLSFLPALDNGFVNFDDADNFLNNPHYRGLGWPQLRWMFTTMLLGHYVPLTWMSLGLNYALGGMDPRGYHLFNLLLHSANAALFFLVARRLLAAAFARREDPDLCLGATFAALAFGAHPLRVESVVWVTERRDLLCGLFFLASTLAYLRGVRGGGPLRTRWWIVSVAVFVLAMLSKAAAMPLPAALVVLDVYPLRRVRSVGWGRLLVEKTPYFAVAGAGAVLAWLAQSSAEAVSTYHRSAAARIGMTGYSLVFYPWKFLWPAALTPLVELPGRVDLASPRFLAPVVLAVAVTLGLLALRRRWPAGLAVWVYSGLMVLPVSGIVVHAGIQLAADRYSYLSGLGLALLAGGGLSWIRARRRQLPAVASAGCIIVAVLVIASWAAGSWRQSRIWRDSETLWRYALAIDPQSAFAHFQLGAALSNTGQPDQAIAEIERAIALLPDQFPNDKAAFHAGLGLLLQQRGDVTGAEEHYRAALGFSRDNAIALNNLGVIELRRGQREEALGLFLQALRAAPGYPGACVNARRVAGALGIVPRELATCR
ncbi:MAG TPA: tetratricopeptide repeat protein [Candidatus Methylomirabilis sp.]|nr:tetratricopeptide repeat protein [Candidatus Methylomirabilis sp.]